MRTHWLRKFASEPLLIVCVLWPLVLLAPHMPGLPRPSIQGLPWRQELIFALLLCAGLGLSTLRGRGADHSATRADRLHVLTLLSAAAFVAWVWLSAIWSANPFTAANLASQWSAYALFFALSTAAANARPRASRLAFVMAGLVVWILAVSCGVETWAGGALTDGNLRVDLKPLLRGSGGFGEMMAVAAPLFAGLALYLRRPARAVACGATAALAWLATLQSLERAPFVGGAAGLLMLFAFALVKRNCRPRSRARAFALAAVLAAVLASQSLPSLLSSDETASAKTTTGTTIARLQTDIKNDDNTRARMLFWGVGFEMLREHPLLGVGANNYETAFPEARARFSERHPDSPLVALNEHLLVVYAHNEYVQLAAETGAIGLTLFLLFAAMLVRTFLRALRHPTKALPALGAGAGLLAFAISSGASASSFRYFGGGLLFFFAASVVAHIAASVGGSRVEARNSSLTPNSSSSHAPNTSLTLSPRARRALTRFALAASIVVTCCAGLQAAGSVLHGMAQASADPLRAERLYRASLIADGWSAQAHFGYASWLYARGRTAESLPYMRYAVAHGLNSSTCFARLATAEMEAGDVAASERTLALAVRVYPRSVFLHVRHALALEGSGRADEAALELYAAKLIDSRAAAGWRQLIFNDIDAAIAAYKSDPSHVAKLGELQPEDAVVAVVQENERRFPEFANTGWRAQMRAFKVQ
ncbi:MAG: O-antigen ligase family protein [Pyrinomonadaceae bacterium]